MTPDVLDNILAAFSNAITAALPFLQGDVGFLFQTFLVITIIFTGVAYAFGDQGVGLHFLLKKILLIGFALFLVTNWLDLTNIIVNSFGLLGLRAGGASGTTLTTADFFSPSAIVDLGFGLASAIFDQINVGSSLFTFNLADLAVGLVAGFTIGLAFIIIALQVFLALIEFKIVTLGGFILLPFAILDRTTSLAERALGFVLSAGLKIFALAIVVSFAFAIIPTLELSEELTLVEAFTVIGTALTFLLLSIKAPGLATSLVTGGPSLGVGAAAQTVVTAAGVGAAAYYGAAAAGHAAVAGGRNTIVGGQMAVAGAKALGSRIGGRGSGGSSGTAAPSTMSTRSRGAQTTSSTTGAQDSPSSAAPAASDTSPSPRSTTTPSAAPNHPIRRNLGRTALAVGAAMPRDGGEANAGPSVELGVRKER